MTESNNLIEVRDLAVEFVTGNSRQRVVEAVSFDIKRGETLALGWFPLSDLPPLSGAINVASLNLLRRERGLPDLP